MPFAYSLFAFLSCISFSINSGGSGRERRELSDSLSATRASKESLEATVAEHTEHLVATHEELRRSCEEAARTRRTEFSYASFSTSIADLCVSVLAERG